MSLNNAFKGKKVGELSAKSENSSRHQTKVWYYGRLIEDYCPVCDTPMPFPFICARCGWRNEDENKEQDEGK